MPTSYCDAFSISLAADVQEDIRPGDVVRTGENFHPHFAVIAVDGDKVWLRNVQSGADLLAKRNRCRKIAGPSPVAIAAE